MNSIMAIYPYKHNGVWMFDDPHVDLHMEPFVSGADEIIEVLASGIDNAQNGFTLLFSADPFPGIQDVLTRTGEEFGGNWYHSTNLCMDGWLCPALFKYFETAPDRIYVQFKSSS